MITNARSEAGDRAGARAAGYKWLTMPIDYDQMRDCLLDALSQHVMSLERPQEMVITCGDMKRRTLNSVLMRGLFTEARTDFVDGEHKVFEQALWDMFSEGTLAPVFKSQRYGGAKSWEEGEFKLTARGLRGFRTSVSPMRDIDSYLESIGKAVTGLAAHVQIVAFTEQAVRAARAELAIAASAMMALALEAALLEVSAGWRAAGFAAEAALPGSPKAQLAWLTRAIATSPAAMAAMTGPAAPEGGLGPLVTAIEAVSPTRDEAGAPCRCAATPADLEAALQLLPAALERCTQLVRLAAVAAS